MLKKTKKDGTRIFEPNDALSQKANIREAITESALQRAEEVLEGKKAEFCEDITKDLEHLRELSAAAEGEQKTTVSKEFFTLILNIKSMSGFYGLDALTEAARLFLLLLEDAEGSSDPRYKRAITVYIDSMGTLLKDAGDKEANLLITELEKLNLGLKTKE